MKTVAFLRFLFLIFITGISGGKCMEGTIFYRRNKFAKQVDRRYLDIVVTFKYMTHSRLLLNTIMISLNIVDLIIKSISQFALI